LPVDAPRRQQGEHMKYAVLAMGLCAIALAGCEKAVEPGIKVQSQVERKDQQTGAAPQAMLWSPEFKGQTLDECLQSAKRDGNPDGARKCKCVIDKAATTVPEQRFKTVHTDPEVRTMIKQIGAAC
jgi:hypothetical protein